MLEESIELEMQLTHLDGGEEGNFASKQLSLNAMKKQYSSNDVQKLVSSRDVLIQNSEEFAHSPMKATQEGTDPLIDDHITAKNFTPVKGRSRMFIVIAQG